MHHLEIPERIGETDGIKALDRNGKVLKNEKCFSRVVSVSRDSMAQCINEVRTDLVRNRTSQRRWERNDDCMQFQYVSQYIIIFF